MRSFNAGAMQIDPPLDLHPASRHPPFAAPVEAGQWRWLVADCRRLGWRFQGWRGLGGIRSEFRLGRGFLARLRLVERFDGPGDVLP